MAGNSFKLKGWPVLAGSVRTAVAAVISLLAARLLRLPEAYWAPITTLVITQSSLGAALAVSWQRFVGTVLGAIVAGVAATHFTPGIFVFGLGLFVLGLLCGVISSARTAYRFAGITLTIVLLVPHTESPWGIARHRFAEVSIGIAVALILAVIWPERDPTVKQ
jgi:uncharacterized membrane protein YgaE (UPF0421/DUF939 family)